MFYATDAVTARLTHNQPPKFAEVHPLTAVGSISYPKTKPSNLADSYYLKAYQEELKQELRTVDRSVVVFVESRHDRRKLGRR